jgi:hypothetical protein
MITEITQLNRDDEGNRFLQPLSRRKLLGVGSTVAAALLTARAADAQQREKNAARRRGSFRKRPRTRKSIAIEGIGELGKSVCSGDCSGQIATEPTNPTGPSTLDGSWTIDLFPQVTNEVFLSAQIELSSLFQSSASALADPYIQIDPSFLSTHPGFSVVVSDGITNSPRGGGSSTVPEPATVWSLGSGLLVLVRVARKNINSRRN